VVKPLVIGFLNIKNNMEQWKEVVDYPSYEISTQGNVRRWDNKKGEVKISTAPAPVYMMFSTWSGGEIKKLYVHREMMRAFKPTDDPKLTHVCFKDNNSYNLNLENLYWSSQTKRMRRRFQEGKYPKGQDHYNAKLSNADVIEIRAMWESEQYTQKAIAHRFGIHISTCTNIIKKRFWPDI
jgi:hypothetical protein